MIRIIKHAKFGNGMLSQFVRYLLIYGDKVHSTLYGIPAKHISRLQRTQNTLARVVTGTGFTDSSSSTLNRLHWLSINTVVILDKPGSVNWKPTSDSPPMLPVIVNSGGRNDQSPVKQSSEWVSKWCLGLCGSNKVLYKRWALSMGKGTFRPTHFRTSLTSRSDFTW